MATTDEQIGRNLANLRGELSQKELAAVMRERGWKWSQATVWSIEKGERPLRLTEAADLAVVLDKPFQLILEDDESVRAQMAAKLVVAADRHLREAVREYDESRLTLALHLDALGPDGYATALGKSWIDVGAHDVVDQVHRDEARADLAELATTGTTQDEIEENQLSGYWTRRLRDADDKHQTTP